MIAGPVLAAGWVSSVLQETMLNSWVATLAQAVLLFALLAVYAGEASHLRRMGHIGFVLAVFGELFVVAGMLSSLLLQSKLGQHGVETFATSGKVLPHIIAMSILSTLFAIGLFLFGLATSRAGVFPRWAGRLVWIGAVVFFAGAAPDLTGVEAAGAILYSAGVVWMGRLLWKGETR
jgi:hypothetical protein